MFSAMQKPLLAIGLSQFGLSILQTMFMFYYVKVYLNKFHVTTKWFDAAQTMFMVWNTINDPIFGYLQEVRGSWMNNRLLVIKILAPFLVGSFVFMWIPWSTDTEGIHLILSLFLYDAFFSAVGVAWGALFADTTRNQPLTRVKALKYSQIAILLSVCCIGITEKLSLSLENFDTFQYICFTIAALSLGCLVYGGNLGRKKTKRSEEEGVEGGDEGEAMIREEDKELPMTFKESIKNSFKITKQVFSQPQFLAIVITNFFHTARSVAHMNFASIMTEVVIPQEILPKGSLKLSLFYMLLTLGPQIVLILNEKLIGRVGAAKMVIMSYIVSFASGFMIIASYDPYIIMIFMFIDCITVHTIAPLFNILLSDFVDDDARKHNRSVGIASIVFSLNALIVKPAQSIAPIIIVRILDMFGREEYTKTKIATPGLSKAIIMILFMTPVLLGGIQYFVMKTMYNFRRVVPRNTHVI